MRVETLKPTESKETFRDEELTVAELEERTAIVHEAGVITPPIETLGYNISPLVYMENVRGDTAPGRSFKARGAYYAMTKLVAQGKRKFSTASAGNHAQGVANAANILGVEVTINMQKTTPKVKIEGVRNLASESLVTINNDFDTFEQAQIDAQDQENEETYFLSAFDDHNVIAGQGTLAYEALKQRSDADRLFVTVGGGGLLAGTLEVVDTMKKAGLVKQSLKVVAVMLEGNDSLLETKKNNWIPSTATDIDTFTEGSAVQTVGEIPAAMIAKYYKHLETEVVTFDDLARALWYVEEENLKRDDKNKLPLDETTSLVVRAGALVRAERRNLEGAYGKESWLTITTGSNASEEKLQELRDRYEKMYDEAVRECEEFQQIERQVAKFGHECLSVGGFVGK